MTTRTLPFFLLAAAGIGCGSCAGVDAGVTYADGAVPGVGIVSWNDKFTEGTVHVEYGLAEDALTLSTPEVPAADGEVTVLELAVATKHFFRVVNTNDKGKARESGVIEATVQPPPQGTPSLKFGQYNPDLACEPGGFILFNYLGDHESGVVVVNRDAKMVWAVRSDSDVQYARTRLGRDGKSILWNTNDYDRVDDIATVERLSVDGTQQTSTRIRNGHHDFVELPDGNIGWIAYEFSESVPLGEDFPAEWFDFPVAYDVLYEAPEGTTDADEPTKVFDHVADWPEGIFYREPITGEEGCDAFLPDNCELGHANSLAYISETDEYQIGFRWLDSILRLDRAGEIQWVFGGPQNEFAGDSADLFVHGHFSDVWADGMFIYDNHDPDPSRLLEYSFDLEAKTFVAPWRLQLENNDPILGDVRRIPIEGCKNLLVSRSKDGILQEITPDGDVVWSAFYNAGNIPARVQYLSSMYDFADQAAY